MEQLIIIVPITAVVNFLAISEDFQLKIGFHVPKLHFSYQFRYGTIYFSYQFRYGTIYSWHITFRSIRVIGIVYAGKCIRRGI